MGDAVLSELDSLRIVRFKDQDESKLKREVFARDFKTFGGFWLCFPMTATDDHDKQLTCLKAPLFTRSSSSCPGWSLNPTLLRLLSSRTSRLSSRSPTSSTGTAESCLVGLLAGDLAAPYSDGVSFAISKPGHKEMHVATIHLPQTAYFFGFSTALAWPVLLNQGGLLPPLRRGLRDAFGGHRYARLLGFCFHR